jgi:F420-0:gamma-glutamyl ligase
MNQKEQEELVKLLKTPNNKPKRKSRDFKDVDGNIKFQSQDSQNLRDQLVQMITEQINDIEDRNVKGCASQLTDIVAEKLTKLQQIIENNIERQMQDMQQAYEKKFTDLIENRCNTLFTKNRVASKFYKIIILKLNKI